MLGLVSNKEYRQKIAELEDKILSLAYEVECKVKHESQCLPEIIMHYNVEDDRYYTYKGEDYVDDTQDPEAAFELYRLLCQQSAEDFVFAKEKSKSVAL